MSARGGKKGLAKIPSADDSPRSARSQASEGREQPGRREHSRPPLGPGSPFSRGPGWQSSRTSPQAIDWTAGPSGELLKAAVRGALHEELLVFFGDPMAWRNGPSGQKLMQDRPARIHGTPPSEAGAPLGQVGGESDGSDNTIRAQYFQGFTADESGQRESRPSPEGSFAQVIASSQKTLDVGASWSPSAGRAGKTAVLSVANFVTYLWTQCEPERTGFLADITRSRHFERSIQIIILCNCVVLGLQANYEMGHVDTLHGEGFSSQAFLMLDIVFQVIYTIELLLKLVVHRQYFFWNDDATTNLFDVFLVIIGYVELLFESGGGAVALRTVRILKLGKALRALKVIAGFRTLRAILVCIQGSFVTLLWSAIMLCIVFYIFSLIFVQQAAARLHQIGDPEDPESIYILRLFNSVQTSMLTLFKASFGGEDWGVALDSLRKCGAITVFFYMLFIAFTQIALINIITGIFVDSAMQNLTPNREQLAVTLEEHERGYAQELEKLCIDVDADQSGCLTKEQFRDGLAEGRIPLLLQLLGLNRHNVQVFFEILCDGAPNKQVDIKQFVRGCMRLKGAASSFDLQTLVSDMKQIERNIAREFQGMDKRMASVEQYIRSGPEPEPEEPGPSGFPVGISPVGNDKGYSLSQMGRYVSKSEQPSDDEGDPL